MPDLELVLQHGWALDASIWSGWTAVASAQNAHFKIAERGYFAAQPIQPIFSERENRKVLVVHSLGLHLVTLAQLKKTDLLVIIGGFAKFHPDNEKQARLSQVAVKRMLQKLGREPVQVLQEFYANCGFPPEYGTSKIAQLKNLPLLKSDLELLNQCTINSESLSLPNEVLILHGDQDQIAPPQHALRLQELCKKSTIAFSKQGTHALPNEQPEWCLEQIQNSMMVARR